MYNNSVQIIYIKKNISLFISFVSPMKHYISPSIGLTSILFQVEASPHMPTERNPTGALHGMSGPTIQERRQNCLLQNQD